MLALIAGTGLLPGLLCARLAENGEVPLVCEMAGFAPDLPPDLPRLPFRLETLGSLIGALRSRGVERVCLAGAVRRPVIDPAAIDAATVPLVPRLKAALGKGDDGALREIVGLFEEAGMEVVGAHDIVPELLPPAGHYAGPAPGEALKADAALAEAVVAELGAADLGQACAVRGGRVLAQEGPEGTAAMLALLTPDGPRTGLLYKAAKPGQDRRVDLPAIGPQTPMSVAEAGLGGIVVEAGGVVVLDLARVIDRCRDLGLTLWIRDRSAP
ncbi:hypothetical protein OG2516_02014 [Oceanicola granulosus HTCC2516]|uniref:Phosphatidate cytidylyltransferase n=1 Tax=Oceanicola granulosus (strain ATCC BAA-861 / DSM 15982 / KCTC 12143 / HTCC2516) TaxID=314256 RepID=Q2CHX1_OCEGH|nr:UDP-2,3-diacylglucosamine diphosphatase LpxI [Oceanicola granulosus]EAR52173.1 hypothetical protein OG2516_02014 [Oceanicola granulosus HTCC2516]